MASNELERVRIPPPELEGLYPPEPDAEVHLRDYLYVVLKRRWIVIAITITALVVSAVWTLRQTPVYTATALVQISLPGSIAVDFGVLCRTMRPNGS